MSEGATLFLSVDKIRMNGFKPAQLRILRDLCQADPKDMNANKYHMTTAEVTTMLRLTASEVFHYATQGLLPPKQGNRSYQFYDAREIIKGLFLAATRKDIDRRIKEQRERELQIKNDVRVGKLIDVEVAETRVIRTLRATRALVIYAMRQASLRVSSCGSPRIAEEILQREFRDTFKLLEAEIQRKGWTDETSKGTNLLKEKPAKGTRRRRNVRSRDRGDSVS